MLVIVLNATLTILESLDSGLGMLHRMCLMTNNNKLPRKMLLPLSKMAAIIFLAENLQRAAINHISLPLSRKCAPVEPDGLPGSFSTG